MEVRLRKQWIVRIANLDTVPKSTLWLQAGQLIPAEVVNRPIQIAELPISVVDALRAMLLDQGVEDVLYQNSRIQMRPNRMDAVAIYGIPIAMQMNEGVMKTNFMSIAHLWFTGSQLTLSSLERVADGKLCVDEQLAQLPLKCPTAEQPLLAVVAWSVLNYDIEARAVGDVIFLTDACESLPQVIAWQMLVSSWTRIVCEHCGVKFQQQVIPCDRLDVLHMRQNPLIQLAMDSEKRGMPKEWVLLRYSYLSCRISAPSGLKKFFTLLPPLEPRTLLIPTKSAQS